jgi:hypothetical protein
MLSWKGLDPNNALESEAVIGVRQVEVLAAPLNRTL